MVALTDITACVLKDTQETERLNKKTDYISYCLHCTKGFQLTERDLLKDKKRQFCSDECYKAAESMTSAERALKHLQAVTKKFSETADKYTEYVEREMTSDKIPDIAPDPYFD